VTDEELTAIIEKHWDEIKMFRTGGKEHTIPSLIKTYRIIEKEQDEANNQEKG
jgi:hypothetical protein